MQRIPFVDRIKMGVALFMAILAVGGWLYDQRSERDDVAANTRALATVTEQLHEMRDSSQEQARTIAQVSDALTATTDLLRDLQAQAKRSEVEDARHDERIRTNECEIRSLRKDK